MTHNIGKTLWEWLESNYKWLFDGVGVSVFIGILAFLGRIFSRKQARMESIPAPEIVEERPSKQFDVSLTEIPLINETTRNSILSQRTVARLQNFIEQMYQSITFRSGSALNPSSYYRLLYEAELPPQLLDYIGSEYQWNPRVFVRALHEGQAIANLRNEGVVLVRESSVQGFDGFVSPTPTNLDRQAGDKFLLKFAEVALNRWRQLCSDNYFNMGNYYTDSAVAFLEALQSEGLSWDRTQGYILPVQN